VSGSGSRSQEPVLTCYKIKDKLYPDTSVPEKAQKRFFSRVPGSLEKENSLINLYSANKILDTYISFPGN